MRRLPKRFERLVLAFFMAGVMVFVISGSLTALNTGIDRTLPLRWLRLFGVAFPIAFPTAFVVTPYVRRLTARVVDA